MIVPLIIRNLAMLHRLEVAALARELEASGKVRTMTWPGTAADRRVLKHVPEDFPRFKGENAKGILRLEGLRMTGGLAMRRRPEHMEVTIPMPALPWTIIAALPGRSLGDLIDDPAFTREMVIHSADGDAGGDILTMSISMPDVVLEDVGGFASLEPRPVIDLKELIGRTHAPIDGAPSLPEAARTDPRHWETALRNQYRVVGLAIDDNGPAPMIEVRFPYDQNRVKAIGRGGFGAWFDRRGYAWRVAMDRHAVAGLSAFLRDHADIVIGGDGKLHYKRGKGG